MRTREIDDGGRRMLVIACDKGDDPVATVTAAARERGIQAALARRYDPESGLSLVSP